MVFSLRVMELKSVGVPDSQLAMVAEMKTDQSDIVSAGPTERGLPTNCCSKHLLTGQPGFSVTVITRSE